jgi:NADPH-dependent F420 reductase
VIGIVGGSGDFGRGLAARLRERGHEVLLGSRTPRDDLVANVDACTGADMVFFSVPAASVEPMSRELAPVLDGKVVVSVATALVFRDRVPVAETGPVSLAEVLAREAPRARVVSGFHTVSSKALADLAHPLDDDVLICGDDEDAKQAVSELGGQLVGGRMVDAGPLFVSRWLETITTVLLHVNRRYKAHTGIRLTGLP